MNVHQVSNECSASFFLICHLIWWELHKLGELVADLTERVIAPRAEPVNDTAIEQGRRGGSAVAKVVAVWIHSEDDVQVGLHLRKSNPM